MSQMEIDLTSPGSPVLWISGNPLKMSGWERVTARQLIGKKFRNDPEQRSFKQAAKAFYVETGVTARAAANFYNKGVYKMTAGSVGEHASLCFRGKALYVDRGIRVCQNIDILDQAVSDGNKNLTPLIAATGQTPKELRKTVGKAAWKAFCKNTFTRNKLLVDSLIFSYLDTPDKFTKLLHAPSTLIRKPMSMNEILDRAYLNKHTGISLKNLVQGGPVPDLQIISDTRTMARRLQAPFSMDWSWRRMQEEHENYTRETARRVVASKKERDAKFTATLWEGRKKEWSLGGVVEAKMLDTLDKIVAESRDMSHCVVSYVDSCYEGRYAVFHLSGLGEETTLGVTIITIGDKVIYHFDQHYGKMNDLVKNREHSILAENIIGELNAEGNQRKD